MTPDTEAERIGCRFITAALQSYFVILSWFSAAVFREKKKKPRAVGRDLPPWHTTKGVGIRSSVLTLFPMRKSRGLIGRSPFTHVRGSLASFTPSSARWRSQSDGGLYFRLRRFFSDNCGTCRYRAGCEEAEKRQLLRYCLLGMSMVPIAIVAATQLSSEKVRKSATLRLFSFDRDQPVLQKVDLSIVPDVSPLPTTQLRLCGCGCGSDPMSSAGGFEISGGAIWAKEHFRCSECGCALIGKMLTVPLSQDAGDESWVFIKGDVHTSL